MSNFDKWKNSTEQLLKKGLYEEALSYVDDLLKKDGIDNREIFSLQRLKCSVFIKAQKYPEIIAFCQEVLTPQLKNMDPLIYLEISSDLCYGLFRGGDWDASKKQLDITQTFVDQLSDIEEIELSRRKAPLLRMFGIYYYYTGKYERAMEYFEDAYKAAEQSKDKSLLIPAISNLGNMAYSQGDYIPALKYYNRVLELLKEDQSLDQLAIVYSNMSVIFEIQGELGLAYEHQTKAFDIREKLKVLEFSISHHILGRINYSKGDAEKAINHFIEAYKLTQQTEINHSFALNILLLIQVLMENNLEEKTEEYLTYLKQSIDNLKDYQSAKVAYSIAQAIVLKSHKDLKDISDAKQLLTDVIDEGNATKYLLTSATLHLCDILIFELDLFHSEELFLQIKEIIKNLALQAETQKLFNLLVQLDLLNSQIALIDLDFDSTKSFLLKAQKLAEEKGLRKLAIQASRLHDNMLIKYSDVQIAIKKKTSLKERIQSSQLSSLMEQIIKRKSSDEEAKAEQPVFFLILDNNDEPLYTFRFLDTELELDLMKELLQLNESLSEGLNIERFSFHDYNVIINTDSSLKFYYVFKGQSFTASLKLEIFIDTLKAFQNVWIQLSTGNMNLLQTKEFIINNIVNELYEPTRTIESSLKEVSSEPEAIEDFYVSISELPKKLQEFKIILNPVRLALVKILYQNFKMPASELRELVGISWGSWSTHIQTLEKAGIIESKRVFIDQKPRVVVSLKSEGSDQYIKLKKALLTI